MNNQVQLLGNMGMQPEITNFENGKKKVKFTFATHESYKNKAGELVEKTSWHNIIAWGNKAKYIIQNGKKGAQLMIVGSLKTKSYLSRTGEKRRFTEIVANQIYSV